MQGNGVCHIGSQVFRPATFCTQSECILCVCRLQDGDATPIVKLFHNVWEAESKEADTSDPEAHTSCETSSAAASLKTSAADSSTSADGQLSRLPADTAAAGDSHNAAESEELSQQGDDRAAADVAADLAEGTSSKAMTSQGNFSIVLHPA